MYVDASLIMGLRSAALLCQRVTNVISFIVKKKGVQFSNYLDDFGGAEVPEMAEQAFEMLGETIALCGLKESSHKAVAPSTRMTFAWGIVA